jgi:hypothetical protein
VLVLGCALGLLVGCFSLDPGHVDSTGPGSVTCIDGVEVELLRYSTRCERPSTKSLVAEVGVGMEFSADQVRTLDSPCAESPNPGVEIQVEHSSLIFDFSNVANPGRFPVADFEGYVLDILPGEDNAHLVRATVDSEANSLGVEDADLWYDFNRLEVNFEGISYDEGGFVRINLWFVSAALIEHVAQ